MANKQQSVNWKSALLEVAGIVFAVLLALWLEGWREEQEQYRQAQENLGRVIAEIQQNRADLITSIAVHQSYIDALSTALKEEEALLDALAPYLKIDGGTTSDAAWQSARMSASVGKIPPEVTMQLAAVYDTQAYYADYLNFFFQRYIDLISNIENDADYRVPTRKFVRHLSVTNSLADQLLERYDGLLRSQGIVLGAVSATEATADN